MRSDDDLEAGFPALEKIGEVITEPKFLVRMNRPDATIFASSEMPKLQNELFHYLLMRETQCSAADAALICIKTKPTIIVEQVDSPLSYEADYLVLH